MKTIYVIHGPNLNMLGIREPELYGRQSYEDLLQYIDSIADSLNFTTKFFQSNHEGSLIDFVQDAYGKADAILINPGAYAHTSIALADALRSVMLPCIEVHLTDINSREPYRRISYTGEACNAVLSGKGFDGYKEALIELNNLIKDKDKKIRAGLI